jgi:flavin-dependent dehydrogenase
MSTKAMERMLGQSRYQASRFPLADGSDIAIIGGGPAGSFFGIHVLEAARRAGRRLAVTIFEPKPFSRHGPVGCNKSAGVLSPPLLANLAQSGLNLPPEVERSRIGCFILHLRGQTAMVPAPGTELPVTVYRGSGPHRAEMAAGASLDAWLLAEAVARGSLVIPEPVVQVSLDVGRPQVQTPAGSHAADLVVLATGVNGTSLALPGTDYQPPRTETMAQDELSWTSALAGDASQATHVFLDGLPGLLFAALVPKGPFVSLSILGEHLPAGSVRRFLAQPDLMAILGDGHLRQCGCRPRIAVQPAQGILADRFVAIGDAAVTRLYKDGIGSAFLTARAAAHTAVFHGVGTGDWVAGYAPTCRDIHRDNRFARWLFDLWRWLQRSPRLGQALLHTLEEEARLPVGEWHWRWAVWAILTGGASYQAACRRLLHPQAVIRFARAMNRNSDPER